MGNQSNPLLNVFRTQWAFLGDRKRSFWMYTTLFIVAGAVDLLNPLVIGTIFNSIQSSITSGAEMTRVVMMIFLLFGLTVAFWLFHGTGRILEQRSGFMVNRNFINDKIFRVFELPVKWHKDHHSGNTIDKINRAAGSIAGFSRGTVHQIYYAFISMIGSLAILFFFDVRAATIALGFSLATIFIVYKIDQRLDKQYREINNYGNKAAAGIFDYISNSITVITLRLKQTVRKEIDKRLLAGYDLEKRNQVLNEIKWAFAGIAISFMTAIVLSWRVYSDYTAGREIMIGTLYILYGYLASVGHTFYSFAWLYGSIVRDSANINSARTIDKEFAKVKNEGRDQLAANWSEVELQSISFRHTKGTGARHLDKIDFRFRRGERIALIGESGSGKSTLLALLRGLIKPDSGKVFVNGAFLDDGFNHLKRNVTLIPQDPELFNNTIKFNLSMGLPFDEKDLKKAMEMSQFKQVCKRLPKGLDTNVLEKGVSLSGGEKQRLALARGILAAKDSDIVLMDEPTSSVDTINEMRIYDSIMQEFKDKTIVSALHRLHLLKRFDYIYIFQRGKIVAEGTFSQIMKTPVFKRMWNKYHSKSKD